MKCKKKLIKFFEDNQILIVSDILRGRGKFTAGWMMVALKSEKQSQWVLKTINETMNVFGEGEVVITSQGSLKIGKITMQRSCALSVAYI